MPSQGSPVSYLVNLRVFQYWIMNLKGLLKAAFFFGLRPKKTQGEKTQEFKNSRKKTQTQAQQKKFRHNLTNKLHIYACSVQNFAEFVLNFEEFPKNSMKFSKNSRILQKLKPKNSISGISKIFRYPECGQKRLRVLLTYLYETEKSNGSVTFHSTFV